MDIGNVNTGQTLNRLTPEEHSRLMKIGACFKCQQTGHLSQDCPKNNWQNQRTPQKTPEPPKKWTPKELQTHMHTLTADEKDELLTLMVGTPDFWIGELHQRQCLLRY